MKKLKKSINLFFAFLVAISPFFSLMPVYAATASSTCNTYVRSLPGTSGSSLGLLANGTNVTILDTVFTSDGSTACGGDQWYKISFKGQTGYSCASNFTTDNKYNRPWNTPGKSIIGGAIFKSENYIAKGQYTSYLFKFNVNPNSSHPVYTHQYMTNVRAPYFEAYNSFTTYQNNGLLNQPLVFTIPIYNEMPTSTNLPNTNPNLNGTTYQELIAATNPVSALAFENKLDAQGFPESYKLKLRALHNAYPNWVFESLKTNLIWNSAVSAEQPASRVDGTDASLRLNNTVVEGSTWYIANSQTTGYFMDPRNFLLPERVLMFEKLAYSNVHTEAIIQSRLNSTFMNGTSSLDNKTYAALFAEAGRTANISSIYLVSQVLQEVGSGGSVTTSGKAFTYGGVTYQGLYNFYNVGAYGSEASPALAGLVWANGGYTENIVGPGGTISEENTYLNQLGFQKNTGYLTNAYLNRTVGSITGTVIPNATVTVTDANGTALSSNTTIKTGYKVTIKTADKTYINTIAIYGDISGDGTVSAADLLYMRKHLLKTYTLSGANLQAAKLAKNDSVGAADLLYLRKYLLDSSTYKITQ